MNFHQQVTAELTAIAHAWLTTRATLEERVTARYLLDMIR